MFKPAYPPTVPTPEAVWDGFLATDIDYSFTVPSFIEVSGSNWAITILILMRLQLAMVARSRKSLVHAEDERSGRTLLSDFSQVFSFIYLGV